MVPRSYAFQRRASSPTKLVGRSEKVEIQSSKPIISALPHKEEARSESLPVQPTVARILEQPAPTKPMVIPIKSKPGNNSTSAYTVRTRGQHGNRRSIRPGDDHRPNAIPPAVAALLALTEIPRKPHQTLRRSQSRASSADRSISIDDLIHEWRQEGKELSQSRHGSPMDVLLERPDEVDTDEDSLAPSSHRKSSFSPSRSTSSESIPSLEAVEPSLPWSDPATPLASASARRERLVSSPPKENCILDHPLLHFNPDQASLASPETTAAPLLADLRPIPAKPRSSLKSNLTASLQALKSAAKSFSNFTAPTIPPDDLLTRSLLSPRFASEMRPKPLGGVPGPALRRYLNPTSSAASASTFSPLDLSRQYSSSYDAAPRSPMIQLQTYSSSRSSGARARRRRAASAGLPDSGTPSDSAGSRAAAAALAVRQREPRENGDFLRVIVLEMNMRRTGKLDARAVGKARVWLPPRQAAAEESAGAASGTETADKAVPARWVGVGVDD